MTRYLIIGACLLTGLLIYAAGYAGIIRNHVPDLLWAWALCETVRIMQEQKFHQGFLYGLLAMPFITEAGQLGLFPGTFDPFDLLVYAGLYTLFFHPQIIGLCKKLSNHSSAA
jgi:hypothetical protein